MIAGEDVTCISWEQGPMTRGAGTVTIEHLHRDPLSTSMDLDAARRLVNRLLGSDTVELSLQGEGLRWVRRSLGEIAWNSNINQYRASARSA
jgi:hypothetical protein